MGFLHQVKKSKAKRLMDGSWRKFAAKKVLQGAKTQPNQTYLDRRQATVVKWVALRLFLNVCSRETGYKVGGNIQVQIAWTSKSRGEVRNISVLGKRQVTLRWVDDPVLRHYGCWWRGILVRRGITPPEGH